MKKPVGQSEQLSIEKLKDYLQALHHSINEMELLLTRYMASEARLEESESRFNMLVEGVEDYAIFLLDTTGRITSWNAGARRIKGYSEEEIIGEHFSRFYPSEDVKRGKPARALEIARQEGRYREEGWRVRKGGSLFWANVLLTPLYDMDGQLYGYGKITRDMTDRKEMEEELRRSEERFRLLIESVRDYAIFMLDTAGKIVSWNVGAKLMKGYEVEEILGEHFSIFYTPEEAAEGKPAQGLKRALAEGHYITEGWRVRKDGSLFWASVVLTPLYTPAGELYGFAKITRDMSDWKAAEEERERLRKREHQLASEREVRARTEQLLRQQEDFLVAVAHELRTPVTVVLGYVELMRRRMESEELDHSQIRRGLQVLHDQGQRISRLLGRLLDFSGIQQQQLRFNRNQIDLLSKVKQVVDECQQMTDRHQLRLITSPGSWAIEGDELHVEQILYNLIENAIKYSPTGGVILVEMRREKGEVVISVTDEGLGIPAEELPQIFSRFYRASNVDINHFSGLGVGLYIVKKLVELHDGRITVHSVEGEGTTFTVTLPLKS